MYDLFCGHQVLNGLKLTSINFHLIANNLFELTTITTVLETDLEHFPVSSPRVHILSEIIAGVKILEK